MTDQEQAAIVEAVLGGYKQCAACDELAQCTNVAGFPLPGRRKIVSMCSRCYTHWRVSRVVRLHEFLVQHRQSLGLPPPLALYIDKLKVMEGS